MAAISRASSALTTAAAQAPGAAVPRATRCRGEVLTRAIYQATLEELARNSFEERIFNKIVPCGTGKSALYRRWTTPKQLVLAALTDPATGVGDPVTSTLAPCAGT